MIGIEKTRLARILRLLTTRGLFKEGKYICNSYRCIPRDLLLLVNRDVFANNRLSLVIKSTCNAQHLLHPGGGIGLQAASVLFDALSDPEYGASPDPGKTALHYAMRQKGLPAVSNVFQILEMDVSHPIGREMQVFMWLNSRRKSTK